MVDTSAPACGCVCVGGVKTTWLAGLDSDLACPPQRFWRVESSSINICVTTFSTTSEILLNLGPRRRPPMCLPGVRRLVDCPIDADEDVSHGHVRIAVNHLSTTIDVFAHFALRKNHLSLCSYQTCRSIKCGLRHRDCLSLHANQYLPSHHKNPLYPKPPHPKSTITSRHLHSPPSPSPAPTAHAPTDSDNKTPPPPPTNTRKPPTSLPSNHSSRLSKNY